MKAEEKEIEITEEKKIVLEYSLEVAQVLYSYLNDLAKYAGISHGTDYLRNVTVFADDINKAVKKAK